MVYSVFGTTVSLKLFGQKLMRLRFDSLEREADFRYSLVRVRENSESIAFYQGEGQEAANTWVRKAMTTTKTITILGYF